ncbi:MAG: Rne/Rng family ribonuclease [Nocardioidaceae bacterium]|nr:MAG: Rne/Rng family ribonuclease [Nocardioidaceae bacterium]
MFQAPAPAKKTAKRATKKTQTARKRTEVAEVTEAETGRPEEATDVADDADVTTPDAVTAGTEETEQAAGEEPGQGPEQDLTQEDSEDELGDGVPRRRRRRGGRRRRKSAGDAETSEDESTEAGAESAAPGRDSDTGENAADGEGSSTTRRRRRRRRAGEEGDGSPDDPANTVVRVRAPRSAEDEIAGFTGSTRLEAKKQRRREGREAGRRRAPIISEAEFLARREAVDRVMVIRQHEDLSQIAVLEDKVLVEHYVSRETQTSLIGNVYLGRVQNVLPSMEAAFIDIGKGRNAVLYAGEVNWDAFGAKDGSQRKIESVLKSGQTVLVQVTKDPIGHKGARLTSQISLPGRFLVYVPDGTTSGISRKLPDTERNRLKTLLKQIVPESAGVIVRTAAEGAAEEELTRDVEQLKARWEDIEKKVAGGNAPQLLYGEPDLTLKVVRDLFTEDFSKLVISGNDAWETVSQYVQHVAPDLADRLEKHEGGDAFSAYRIHEQIAKGLDRKVWLPSGGSLIIDRTEAMTVVDVNTGKFTGSGGNLEETVTKNNLEAAEEIVRQLRLRDIGGIIVVDFIDMVLESNRDLVLRRLVECLGRDRTRHQVAEVTSLGLVQMTRKRIGTGLLEAFSHTCEHCQGRGVIVSHEPVEAKKKSDESEPRRSRRRGRGKSEDSPAPTPPRPPSPADIAAMARPEPPKSDDADLDTADLDGVAVDTVAEMAAEPLLDFPSGAEDDSETPDVVPAPEVVSELDAESVVEPVPGSGVDEPLAEGTGDVDATTDEQSAEPAVSAAPTIVTSVRRFGARRAAGPPAAPEIATLPGLILDEETPAPLDLTDGVPDQPENENELHEGSVEDPDAGAAAHVPIKRKGTRKR